jgi:predicted ArsR family transcriptional regulator
MSSTELTRSLSAPRREILAYVKLHATATIGQLAEHLGISDEAVRQHVLYLENQGWISGEARRSEPARAGRPVVHYSLTDSGDHLFPKRYDDLTVLLIDTLVGRCGVAALEGALRSITDAQVKEWEPRLAGKSLEKRIEMLRGFYFADDPYTSVEKQDGELVLVERNCPFQNVASARPQLCSTTVSTLTRLLGARVERRQRFQNGDGRCTFQIHKDQPVDTTEFRFEFEDQ